MKLLTTLHHVFSSRAKNSYREDALQNSTTESMLRRMIEENLILAEPNKDNRDA